MFSARNFDQFTVGRDDGGEGDHTGWCKLHMTGNTDIKEKRNRLGVTEEP